MTQPTYRLFRTAAGILLHCDEGYVLASSDATALGWDNLVLSPDLIVRLEEISHQPKTNAPTPEEILAPVGNQEIWAAGVTYLRSREARMDESLAAGGSSFYDRVYEADRPELFFKSTPARLAQPYGPVRLKSGASWMVPEPELAILFSPDRQVIGCTVANDLTARDIEAENPLYLPQAKMWELACVLGPSLLVGPKLPVLDAIVLSIERSGIIAVRESAPISSLKRTPAELSQYLFSDLEFPLGCFLLTGTGIVPRDDFSLESGDNVRIEIASIGAIQNQVE